MGKERNRDIIILVILLFITIVGTIYATFLLRASFVSGEEVSISYEETSSLDYKVWLLDNKFYDSDYLDEEYDVVASSIKDIELDFDYLLRLSNYVQGSSYYMINSKIIAYQKGDNTKRKIWDYEKIILDKVITNYDVDSLVINNTDSFKVDYQFYKDLMNKYQKNYKVSLVGDLIIEIRVKTDLVYDNFKDNIDLEEKVMEVVIPLTDNIVSIAKKDIDDNRQELIEKGESYINYVKLSLSVISLILAFGLCIYMGISLVKIIGIDSKYIKNLKKILKTYGSVIVDVDSINIEKGVHEIKVSSFYELLDAQQELKKPILFYNVKPNKKAIFAIKYDDDMLIYRMDSCLYEKNDKKVKSDRK